MKFPTIKTNRLIFREITTEDALMLFEIYSDDNAMRYWDTETHKNISTTIQRIQNLSTAWSNNQGVSWGMVLKESNQLIGQFSLHSWNTEFNNAQLGYIISPSYWSNGYGSEALKTIVNFGFSTLGLTTITAEIDPANISSSTILKRFGFKYIKSRKNDYFLNGEYFDTDIYSINNS